MPAKVVMPYTLAYLQENDFQNGMNVTWQLVGSKMGDLHGETPQKQLFDGCFLSEIMTNKSRHTQYFFGWVEIEDDIHSLQRYAPG